MKTPLFLTDLLNLLFPGQCLLCRKPLIEKETHICLKCLYDLPRTCFGNPEQTPVTRLFAGHLPVVGATALLRYKRGGYGQILIRSLKYKGNKALGHWLGKLAARELAGPPNRLFPDRDPVDLIIPVPLHPSRFRQRGYNQAEEIAAGLSEVTGIPLETNAVCRIRKNESQTRQQAFQRKENVTGIFALSDSSRLCGKHVLLVDDVITTGSTMSSCAETLLSVPDIRLSFFGLALAF